MKNRTLPFRHIILNYFLLMVLAIISTNQNSLMADSPDVIPKWWQAGPDVNAIVIDSLNRKVFLGGNINYLGKGYNYAMGFDIQTGEPSINYPMANRAIRASVPDGNGGWFIAGDFKMVGGKERMGLAQIDSQGNVTSFVANTNNSSIHTLSLSGNILYAGGWFSSIGGVERSRIAAINISTGAVTDFNPNVNNLVFALAVHGNTVYFSGQFTSVSGESRFRIAAVDATTGELLPWNPAMNSFVFAMGVFNDKLYVGGDFTTMAGETRNRAASFDLTDGSLTSWNPNVANSNVRSFAFDDEIVYMGGYFTNVAGENRQRLAAFDLNTGALTSWNPQGDISGSTGVYSLLVSGENIIAAGTFPGFNSETRQGVAIINKTTGQLTDWQVNAAPGGIVHTATVSGNTVFLGGTSRDFGVKLVNALCALDLDTGEPVDWAPNLRSVTAGGTIFSLLLNGDTLYAGGSFNTINGIQRANLASFNAKTGELMDWNPNPLGNVWGLGFHNGILYVGGNFNLFGTVSRPRLASFVHNTGELTDWAPTPNNVVHTFAFHGNTMYLGGNFTQISGSPRQRLAAFDLTDGSILPWNPEATGRVNKIMLVDNGESLLIGGNFGQFNGELWGRFVKLNLSNNDFSAWKPMVLNDVNDILVSGNTVYIAGTFVSVENESRRGVAALDMEKPTDMIQPWAPSFHMSVSGTPSISALAHYNGMIFLGGNFQLVNDKPHFGFAVFPDVNSITDNPVTLIELEKESILFGLFPNPATDRITIQSESGRSDRLQIEIFDLSGRIMKETRWETLAGENLITLNIEQFPRGMYFIRLRNSINQDVIKFLKN